MPRIKKEWKWVPLTQQNFAKGLPVRVSPRVERPSYDWGEVKPLEEGVIVSGGYSDYIFKCDFPSQKSWNAYASEMEVKIVGNGIK